jgi:hypothetical protein
MTEPVVLFVSNFTLAANIRSGLPSTSIQREINGFQQRMPVKRFAKICAASQTRCLRPRARLIVRGDKDDWRHVP